MDNVSNNPVRRVQPRTTWEDLTLPAGTLDQLRQIAAACRERAKTFTDWGQTRGTAGGLAALFLGAPGSAKLHAAEAVAADLGVDLHVVDLSRVVSKYIGETEKNLGAAFDDASSSGAVIFFDEADAIFGRRSEVKDDHTRYANIEVTCLLQRIEECAGLIILGTNNRSIDDPAFLRRFRFVLEFKARERPKP